MKNLISINFIFLVLTTGAQDLDYARTVLDTLSAQGMHGRGYIMEGDKIAANFISKEFQKAGLSAFGSDYYQKFAMPINTFPDTLRLRIGQKDLVPGKDFTVLSNAASASGNYPLFWMLKDSISDVVFNTKKSGLDLSEKVVVTDLDLKRLQDIDDLGAAGYIFLMDKKVWWHVSIAFEVKPYFALQVLRSALIPGTNEIEVDIQNSFIENYPTQNVIGYIKGKNRPEKYMVFTAHYDHLGRMGPETYFPGANDNASGTAMILDLVRYYTQPENQPDFTLVFMAFAAEEAGLLGSSYYAMHPYFPLGNIEFLINLDMVGSGSEGIKVVNGSIFEREFKKLQKINQKNNFLPKVSKRGEAANSDHYPFYARGVPSFFIYTLGPECSEYHNIYDTPENVPFTNYKNLFSLLTHFVKTFK
ncbi:MAG: M28 family peptidase [Bacteroidetes bacterium]|nr:M28 family peptidase [Bacteroidota bacterium]